MTTPRWVPPESERHVGLGLYITNSPGTGGSLKATPEDFQVQEISSYPRPDANGPVVVLRIVSRNWEQHELARQIAVRVGVPPDEVRWAGTKDRRAVAERLFSYAGPPPDPTTLELPEVRLVEWYRSRQEVVLGHHYGNRFDVRIRGISGTSFEARGREAAVLDELRKTGVFPNFFGVQRFGEIRPITHEVGRHLVRGDVAGAIEAYLVTTAPGEQPLGWQARRDYADHRDPGRALREFPTQLRFERHLLERLARGDPPVRALRVLSRPLRKLFVSGFQSYLFNRFLSRTLLEGISLTEPQPGDWMLRVSYDGTTSGRDPIPVTLDNLAEARELVAKRHAVLGGPLLGFGTPPLTGVAGTVFEQLLEEETVARNQFAAPATPELASRGTWRPRACPTPSIEADPPETVAEASSSTLRLRFSLPKGTYATVLLREITKAGATESQPAPNRSLPGADSSPFF